MRFLRRLSGLIKDSQFVVFYLITLPIALMPQGLSSAFGRFLGMSAYYLWSERRRVGIENVKRVKEAGFLPDVRPEEVVKGCFQNLGISLIELIKLYHGRGRRLIKGVRVDGLENLQRALRKERGVLLITGHCGNWELMALFASKMGLNMRVVARRQNSAFLNRVLESARRRYGNEVIYKEGAIKQIIKTLKSGGIVGLLIDQSVVPSEGVVVDFLGSPAWSMKAPVLIARKTGSPVVPAFIHRNRDGHVIEIHPEVEALEHIESDVASAVALLNSYVERYVMEHPSEWLWIHRRWKRRELPQNSLN